MYIHVCITNMCMQTELFHYCRMGKQHAEYACLRYQGFIPTGVFTLIPNVSSFQICWVIKPTDRR
jgi:hypothetical protein